MHDNECVERRLLFHDVLSGLGGEGGERREEVSRSKRVRGDVRVGCWGHASHLSQCHRETVSLHLVITVLVKTDTLSMRVDE